MDVDPAVTPDLADHWDRVYSTKTSDQTSWYQPRAETSLRLLAEATARVDARPGSIVDVGAGTSTLVDGLLAAGWSPVTLLDVSSAALEQTRLRLDSNEDVGFVVADILHWRPETTFDAWHDRAVFHFLTGAEQQHGYVVTAARAVRTGGILVIGTFGPNGPEQCSGLPVARHDANSLDACFRTHFDLLTSGSEVHYTPWNSAQEFTWATLRRR